MKKSARVKRQKILAQVYVNAAEEGAGRWWWRRTTSEEEKQGEVCRVTREAVCMRGEQRRVAPSRLGDTAHVIQLPGGESERSQHDREEGAGDFQLIHTPLITSHTHTHRLKLTHTTPRQVASAQISSRGRSHLNCTHWGLRWGLDPPWLLEREQS